MKRLGWPMAKEMTYSRAFAALFAALLLGGCGSRVPPAAPVDPNATDTSTQTGDSLLGGTSTEDNTSSSIVQGAFDQSSSDLSNTQAPSSVGSLSQQQQSCTSATSSSSSSQGLDFFNQISQPNYYGTSNACFASQVNPTQLLSQAYTFYATMAQCQAIALAQVNQIQQTPQNILGLMYWATGFLAQCAQRATLLEGQYGYAAPLANGISIRAASMSSGANRIRSVLLQRAGH